MKRTFFILLFVVTVVSFVASVTFIQPAFADQKVYVDGTYRLVPGHLQFRGESTGPGYRLKTPGRPSLRGISCCCYPYLPCVRKP